MFNQIIQDVIGFLKPDIKEHEKSVYNRMSLIMYLTIFTYYVLRTTKDTLVTDITQSSALLPVLKFLGTWPAAIIAMSLYTIASSKYSQQNIYYAMSALFGISIPIFGLILLPNLSYFVEDPAVIESMMLSWKDFTITFPIINYEYPAGELVNSLILIRSKWPVAVYYVIAELYGTFLLSVMFWGFLNTCTTTEQSKRFYPMIIIWAQVGTFTAGLYSEFLTSLLAESAIYPLIATCSLSIGTCVFLYSQTREILGGQEVRTVVKKEEVKLSVFESITALFKTPYLALLMLIVLCYGMSMGFAETCSKDLIVWYCKLNGLDKQSFFAKQTMLGSVVAILFSVLFKNFFKKNSWKTTALVVPAVMLVTNIIFFASGIYAVNIDVDNLNMVNPLFGINFLALSVCLGVLQGMFTKIAKYSFFDTTKEAAYIPLDKNAQSVGKGLVDGFGGRTGKALNGVISTLVLLPIYGCARYCLFQMMCLIFALNIVWILAVFALSSRYEEAVAKKRLEEAAPQQ